LKSDFAISRHFVTLTHFIANILQDMATKMRFTMSTRNISAKMELLNGDEPIKIEGRTSKLLNGSPNFVHFVGTKFNL